MEFCLDSFESYRACIGVVLECNDSRACHQLAYMSSVRARLGTRELNIAWNGATRLVGQGA